MVDVSSSKNNITIKVENTNKTNSITTTPSVYNNSISATADTAQYWSKQSRLSAENSKESALESKYYAELANSYIDGFEDVVTNNTNNIITTSNDYINQITGTANTALTDIEDARVDAVDNITTVKDESIASVEAKGNEANALVNTGIANINTAKTEAVNAVTTTKNNAVTEINNKVSDGKKELNDIIEAGGLNINDKLTNCLLEVPQNIKLELVDGVLTLKAGSKVIVPNGAGIFEERITTVDRTYNIKSNSQYLITENDWVSPSKCVSGATDSLAGSTYHIWYDTTNNIVKLYGSDTSTPQSGRCLPFALVTCKDGNITIDQVFNGMGYIGSTVWVDKGVKGLIPNGFNNHKGLNNIEAVTKKINVITQTGTYDRRMYLLSNGGINITVNSYDYNFEENFVYINNVKSSALYIGDVNMTNSVITYFQPKLPVRLVNWDDIQELGKGGVGLQMFDTILKDHVLTYEESKGLALQGTYVYKEALAGSRYGYPDFYDKCLEEYNNSTNASTYLKSNVNITGIIRDNNGIISGLSAGNYPTVPQLFAPANSPWEFVTKISTGDLSDNNIVIGCTSAFKSGLSLYITTSGVLTLNASSNGTSWNISNATTGSTLSANTAYWLKIKYTGSAYNVYYSTNGVNWNLDITVNNSTAIYQGSYYWVLGGGVIGGTAGYYNTTYVDLNETYININSSRWWSGTDKLEYKKNSNGHLFYAISNKSKVDEYFNKYGSAWFYGIDTTNERIFLPRNNFFDQATGDSTEVGKTVKAGLPNITGTLANTFDSDATGQTGAFYNGNIVANGSFGFDGNSHSCVRATHLDAYRSNSIYGASNTVQPNAVKKLLYICVGNTVSDTSWVDVVTQVQGGVKDLEDKTNEGIEALSNASNALRQTQITNCLLEVPQNIKLELNDGVLTLKAGSKVIVPNGAGVFKEYLVNTDTKRTSQRTGQYFAIMLFNKDNWSFAQMFEIAISNVCCGTSDTLTGTSYHLWYDTTNNLIKYYGSDGTTNTYYAALPLGLVTGNGTQITSIDQIFNGFGYIGSTVWVDKGVKGLIPNGRNEDGTLNNIEVVTSKVITRTFANTEMHSVASLFVNTTSIGRLNNKWHYNEEQNLNIQSNGVKYSNVFYGNCNITNGVISNFQPKLPFRVIDWNEYANTPHITETYRSGTSWYRIYSDGWCEQGGHYTNTNSGLNNSQSITLLKPFANTDYLLQITYHQPNQSANVSFRENGFKAKSTDSFTFGTQSTGYSLGADWYACGYIV